MATPNSGRQIDPSDDRACAKVLGRACSQTFRVDVRSSPGARLLVRILEPEPGPGPPRATIFVVHGWWKDMAEAAPITSVLADAGYRCVLVDLRGHGGSTGEWTTFGVNESVDLEQVLDALEARGLVSGPVGAYGISMGAATVIQWAADDPRVRALVAVASFASFRETGVRLFRQWVPFYGWLAPTRHLDAALVAAAADAGFDADAPDPEKAATRVHAPILLIQGTKDRWVLPESGERIRQAAAGEARVVFIEGMAHDSRADPGGRVSGATLEWFDRWLPSAVEQRAGSNSSQRPH